MNDCFLGIVRGEARCAVVADESTACREAIAEWSADSRVTELVRVPVEVARQFLFKPWPGREAAIASLPPLPAAEEAR